MIETVLKSIPKGIEEYTTIFGLLGFLLLLLSPHVKTKWKLAFASLLLFIISWRMGFSRIKKLSSRYSSGMIIPFVLLSVYCFYVLRQKRMRIVSLFAAITLAVLLLNYIREDLKRNKRDMNYYAVAEVIRKSITDKKEEKFFVSKKDYYRIAFLSRTDDIGITNKNHFLYRNNYEKPYFPSIIDIDSDNSVVSNDGSKKLNGSFLTGKSANKRINLFYSAPLIHLEANPAPASFDITKSILKNGTIELIDSEQESQKKLAKHISNYKAYSEYYRSARTPQNITFHIFSGAVKPASLGIESVIPIDGQNSASIRYDDGNAFLFFSQKFHLGQYSYSFLIRGKRGTEIQPVYWLRFAGKWTVIPIGLFTIPDSRTYRISCSFNIDELKEDNDHFLVGVRVLRGEALLDDFVLNREDFD